MQFFLVLISSVLWGITNPFIRKASAGLKLFDIQIRFLIITFNFDAKVSKQ
jgi:drug/metabolite transporter (DMT)-like permease